jgi:hypothetical protein
MAVNIQPIEDERAEQMLQNPREYFNRAREEAREQVQGELRAANGV